MQILDVNQMVQYYLTSLELVVIFATVCAALELTFPAFRYSFASNVRGVRNWILARMGYIYLASLRCELGLVRNKAARNDQFRCVSSL
ncbi:MULTISPECIES: hypothetical protein [unclassified Mesorhizobium]|uniref:hypothetical protein n=1 Tax=unclassified Mesorhizobium TaxID=325217 RepID=UPI0033354AC0